MESAFPFHLSMGSWGQNQVARPICRGSILLPEPATLPLFHLCQPKLPRTSDLAVWTGHHHDVFTSAPEDFFRAVLSDFLKLLRLDSSGCSLSQVTLLFSLSRSTPLSPVLIASLACFGNIPTPQTWQPEQANSESRSR